MQIISASFAVGLNWPVSIELIVLRETPTVAASCACDSPCSLRTCFMLFFSISLSSISLSRNVAYQADYRRNCAENRREYINLFLCEYVFGYGFRGNICHHKCARQVVGPVFDAVKYRDGDINKYKCTNAP